MSAEASAQTLLLGTSGDYPPFSSDEGGEPRGFDLDLARAFASERGLALEVVRFRWPDLASDLAAGRFDVAMSGVTVRPERSLAGYTSVPVAEGGAVALVRAESRLAAREDLDRAEVRIAVNRGGHLERVARALFPRAAILAVTPNSAVRETLLAGSADAALSDVFEAPVWESGAPPLRRVGPLTRDRKAFLVRAERRDLAAELDLWLLAREADGALARWRAAHLPAAGATRTAEPLPALLAALDERLALMPLVAEAKRARGLPVEDPAREAQVVEGGLESFRTAARATGRAPVAADAAVRALFRVQVEVARAVQRAVLAGPPPAEGALPPPALETELRPALLRIGEKTARAAAALASAPDCDGVRGAARDAIRSPHVTPQQIRALADAVAALGGATCAAVR